MISAEGEPKERLIQWIHREVKAGALHLLDHLVQQSACSSGTPAKRSEVIHVSDGDLAAHRDLGDGAVLL